MPRSVSNPIDAARNEREKMRNRKITKVIDEIADFFNMRNVRRQDVLERALETLKGHKEALEEERRHRQFLELTLNLKLEQAQKELNILRNYCSLGSKITQPPNFIIHPLPKSNITPEVITLDDDEDDLQQEGQQAGGVQNAAAPKDNVVPATHHVEEVDVLHGAEPLAPIALSQLELDAAMNWTPEVMGTEELDELLEMDVLLASEDVHVTIAEEPIPAAQAEQSELMMGVDSELMEFVNEFDPVTSTASPQLSSVDPEMIFDIEREFVESIDDVAAEAQATAPHPSFSSFFDDLLQDPQYSLDY